MAQALGNQHRGRGEKKEEEAWRGDRKKEIRRRITVSIRMGERRARPWRGREQERENRKVYVRDRQREIERERESARKKNISLNVEGREA